MTARIALVTGAGSGIGRAASMALARDGFTVVLAGRRPNPLAECEEAIAAEGGAACSYACNIGVPSQIEALFDHVAERYGRLDLLFNNAGRGAHGAIDTLDLDPWREVVDVNLTGTFLCTQSAFRLMKAQTPQGGRIINNGSISAHSPRPASAAYTATKHAVTGLTKATALDGRPFNIACGQIDIGNAASPNR